MSQTTRGYLYLFVTILLFSTYEVVSKTLIGSVSPLQINVYRFFLGGFLLLGYLIYKRNTSITAYHLFMCTLVGIINVVISMNLVLLSLWIEGGRASVTAALISTNPLFVLIIASLFDKEKITGKNITGIILCIAGVAFIFDDTFTSTGSYQSALLALGSSLSFAIYTVMGKKLTSRIGSSTKMNCYSFLTGATVLLIVMLIIKSPVAIKSVSAFPQLVYLGIMVTGVAYIAYFKGLTITGAGRGSLLYFLKPVIASLLAIIFLAEQPTIGFVAGTALILAGLYIAILLRWPRPDLE
ncbi:MAG TPA: DMT family transporter [Spirochaetota bacterium]|nr:DMT family transporter [Spirochaetota bacterium]